MSNKKNKVPRSPDAPKTGHSSQKGYPRYYKPKWNDICQTCRGEKTIRDIKGSWVDCPRCSDDEK